MRLQKILTLGVVALLIGSGAIYAALTGIIAGKIVDSSGNPIPGVTVTVTGPNLPGSRVDTTSEQGTFRMPELPPGVYSLKAELMGLQTVERTDLKVSINSTATVNFAMELQKFEATEVVVGTAPVIDTKSTTVKTTIEKTVSDRLPGANDLFSSFAMAGGITSESGNVTVHGASHTDNLYLFDGVDTTDPLTGTFGSNLNSDAIQEVEVQTSAFAAEYGRARGGIVNAVTKSGTNEFHGSVSFRYGSSDWRADYTSPNAVYASVYERYEPSLTIDGPILKDKLFFFLSYQSTIFDRSYKTVKDYGLDNEVAAGLETIARDRIFNLPYAKLTFQPNQAHKFVVSYSGENTVLHSAYGDRDHTPDAWGKQEQGGPFMQAEWTWLYSSNLFFVTRYGANMGILNVVPETDSDNPSFYDQFTGTYYNNYNQWGEEDRTRSSIGFTASYFLEDLIGSHEWKSGFEYQRTVHDDTTKSPGGAHYIINNEPVGDRDNPDYYTGTEAQRSTIQNPGTATESGDYYAFYLQDTWTPIETLTLNVGFRYEYSVFFNDKGDSAVPAWTWGWWDVSDYKYDDGSYKSMTDMKFDDMLAPRIGFNWDVFGDQRTSMNGFWGRFYNPFTLQLASMYQPFEANVDATRTEQYIGDAWFDMDKNGIPDDPNFFSDSNWELVSEGAPGFDNFFDPNIKAEYTDQYVIGLEHALLKNFSLSVNYTHSETNDMIEDTGIFVDEFGNVTWTYRGGISVDEDGNRYFDTSKDYDPREKSRDYDGDFVHHLYYVTNAAGNTREYDGIEISAIARLKTFDLQASYTYSKSEGSVIETQESTDGYDSGVQQFSGQFDTWATSNNLYGELPWSARHYLKFAASWHHDFADWYEFSAGVNSFWQSGYYYSRRAIPSRTFNPDDPTNDINDRGTWTGKPPYSTQFWAFPDGRGTYQLPSLYAIDLSIQNAFKFGKLGTLTLLVDVFNVTDYQGILSENDEYNKNFPEQFGQADDWQGPRVFQAAIKYAF